MAEAGDSTLAAIGSEQCAKMYGLQVLQQGIQNRRDNFTRFVILARQSVLDPACGRISLVVRVQHKAGALYAALSRFAEQKINLLKLESRPIPDSPFEFCYGILPETWRRSTSSAHWERWRGTSITSSSSATTLNSPSCKARWI